MSAALILQFVMAALQALPVALADAATIKAEVDGLLAQLKLFQSQNRDPTPEEWAALNLRMMAALANLQAAKPLQAALDAPVAAASPFKPVS